MKKMVPIHLESNKNSQRKFNLTVFADNEVKVSNAIGECPKV